MEWMINGFIQNPKCFKKNYAKVGKEKRKYKMKRGIWIPKQLWMESRLRKLLCYQENSGYFLETRMTQNVEPGAQRSELSAMQNHFQAAGLNIQWVWYITLHYLIHYIILFIILLILKIVLNTYNIKFAIYPFLSVQFSDIKYVHNVVQPSPPYILKLFTISKRNCITIYNSPFPLLSSLC